MPRLPSVIGCPHCMRTFIQKSGFSQLKQTKCPLCGSVFRAWEAKFYSVSNGNKPVDITEKIRDILDCFREKYDKRHPEPVFIDHIEASELTYSYDIGSPDSYFERNKIKRPVLSLEIDEDNPGP